MADDPRVLRRPVRLQPALRRGEGQSNRELYELGHAQSEKADLEALLKIEVLQRQQEQMLEESSSDSDDSDLDSDNDDDALNEQMLANERTFMIAMGIADVDAKISELQFAPLHNLSPLTGW